jgi:2-polyprenyl-3-methyl-5-hydroxy-6-metoxy-1,4-benzoquinol methylase
MDDNEIELLDQLESTHWWYIARKEVLRKWAGNLRPGSRILDIGAASGGNGLMLRKMGFEIVCVELSNIGYELCKEKKLHVIQADARKIPIVSESFDAIVCLDVLEHIEEDTEVVSEIHRLLKQNGDFLISVPEDMEMWSSHDVHVGHVRRYSKMEVVNLLAFARLSIEYIWSANFILKPIVKMLRKKLNGSDLKKMNVMLNFTLLLIARAESRIGNKTCCGMTIYARGKKAT